MKSSSVFLVLSVNYYGDMITVVQIFVNVVMLNTEWCNVFLQRDQEKPCLNDVTEVGTVRKVGLSLALLLALGVLLPLWDGIVEEASTSLF